MSLSLEAVRAAADRIHGRAVRTPLLESRTLSALTGGKVFVKPEVLQRTGSFKYRGAMSRMTLLTAEERRRGVIAFSSGNHAQGVAAAARDLGTTAVIVMPIDAPRLKLENTRALGAEVVLYDRYKEDRAVIGRKLAEERKLTLVPPYDDQNIMAGQGTIGLEIAADIAALGETLDVTIMPLGGGGLASGIATAISALSPRTKIYGVEPQAFDDTKRSIAAGERVSNAPDAKSICDALQVQMPGELTFPINRRLLSDVLTVSDDEVLAAMATAFRELKLVTEPGGAVALAALLSQKLDVKGKTVAVVLSGGNVDAEMFIRALKTAD
ncbi:MAG: pyridoxal-phosphate dependent enzyme [Alphaproteobacteria bacterium]|nr:pyridoxal-phosphate dependent enzyme [Alphaproteobacteria bacterium]